MNKVSAFIKKNKTVFAWVIVTLLAGGVAALLSGSFDIYETYNKPPLAPPAILFPIAWTVLYILMGVAAGRVAMSNDLDKGNALKLYILQLAINVIWPVIFFRFEAFKFACVWLALLIILVIATYKSFHIIDKTASWLLLPYVAWLLFAFYLNLGFVALNS